MTDERRYRDEEIAEIFEAAATPPDPGRRSPASADGLTLAELQAIGREVGVAPDRIADAAAAIDRRRGALPPQTSLGMPISVARSVDLPRALTDREWSVLVGELRETFDAQGRDASSGGLRSWSNGNLRASVEPTEAGWRFRIRTLKGDAAALNRAGTAGILMAVVLFVFLRLTADLSDAVFIPALVGALSAGALGATALRLPRWAQEREEQMEYIVGRVLALTRPAPDPESGADTQVLAG